MFASSREVGGIEIRPFFVFHGDLYGIAIVFCFYAFMLHTVRCFARPFWAVDVFLCIYPSGHSHPLMYVSRFVNSISDS